MCLAFQIGPDQFESDHNAWVEKEHLHFPSIETLIHRDLFPQFDGVGGQKDAQGKAIEPVKSAKRPGRPTVWSLFFSRHFFQNES